VSQVTLPPPKIAPRVKRRRTQSESTPPLDQGHGGISQSAYDENSTCQYEDLSSCEYTEPADLGILSVDFPGIPAYLMDSSLAVTQATTPSLGKNRNISPDPTCNGELSTVGYQVLDHEQSDTSPNAPSEHTENSVELRYECTPDTSNRKKNESTFSTNNNVTQVHKSRRRRRCTSPPSFSEGVRPESALSLATDLLSSGNKTILTEKLLQIYHESFENALACWLTERTCPYSAKVDTSLVNRTGPDWNRIYHRVFRLDRLASSIRGRPLTVDEDRAVSKALNLSILSFATQWVQSPEKDKARYPFHHDLPAHGTVFNKEAQGPRDEVNFDRTIQIVAWHKARTALQSADKVESFRLALAHLIFSLAQKPVESNDKSQGGDENKTTEQSSPLGLAEIEEENSTTALDPEKSDSSGCETLMSKLSLAIDAEGPSDHLEKGLRLIHFLKSRIAMCGDRSRSNVDRGGRRYQPSANRIDVADRATVDLLFWLGVMFDTLSSAMHKRPLVISDEDSDVYASEPKPVSRTIQNSRNSTTGNSDRTEWDEHLLVHQSARLERNPTRWPCAFEEASSLLCDAAPVKILLYRKITRIQTLLARSCSQEMIEESITAALDICDHWERLYAPFLRDCICNHDRLPPKIQSWYVCLTGHWHFATLLLADLIEAVDESGLGTELMQAQRSSCEMVAHFRESNCQTLSDLARCACPQDVSLTELQDSRLVYDRKALLTEPWTAILIRAFARAGVVLLESESMLPHHGSNIVWTEEEALRRADDCIRALWYLARRFDMALDAAKILTDALEQKRQGPREKLDQMTSALEAEIWHDLPNTSESL
jgi:hypothetical protein